MLANKEFGTKAKHLDCYSRNDFMVNGSRKKV
jgi:hypothetical protein